MFKRVISVFLSVLFLFGCMAVPAAAETSQDMSPYASNADNIYTKLSISSSGKATITIFCNKSSDKVTSMVAITYLQRKVGLIWVKVDNGLEGNKWREAYNYTNTMSKNYTIQLSKTGTYRIKTEYTIYETGKYPLVFERECTATYN